MAEIVATFEVNAGTTTDLVMDTSGLSPDEIAERLQDEGAYVGVCHQCAKVIVDPEVGDLAGFSVDGMDHWAIVGEAPHVQ